MTMKKIQTLIIASILMIMGNFMMAQDSTGVATGPPPTISQSLGLFAFPANDQDKATQDADEMTCFKWAKEQTGFDPINPTQVEAETVEAKRGGAVRGAARGAAAGAAIGSISGDAGDGAAVGAVVGGMRGRRAQKAQAQQQQKSNNDAADAKEKEMLANYKKAYSACMEAKGYTIK
jgi:Glycine-zipper domain